MFRNKQRISLNKIVRIIDLVVLKKPKNILRSSILWGAIPAIFYRQTTDTIPSV